MSVNMVLITVLKVHSCEVLVSLLHLDPLENAVCSFELANFHKMLFH